MIVGEAAKGGLAPGSFRRDIEGLRGVSILFVLLMHARFPTAGGILFPRGYIGVDIFFVISGYLITSILLRPGPRSAIARLADFYIGRVVRLAPALLALVSVVMVCSSLSGRPDLFADDARDAIATLFFAENLRLVDQLRAGIDINLSPWPFSHAWSLGVEAQFYLLFAPIALFFARFRWRYLLVALVGAALASIWLISTSTTPGFQMLLPARLFPLALGAAIALLPPVRGAAWTVISAGGIVALLALLVGYGPEIPPEFASALPALLIAPTLWRSGGDDPLSRALESRPLGFIGRISYSLYLWHWPIVGMFASYPFDDVKRPLLIVGLSLLAAAVSRRVLEEPFLRTRGVERRMVALSSILLAALLGIELTVLVG